MIDAKQYVGRPYIQVEREMLNDGYSLLSKITDRAHNGVQRCKFVTRKHGHYIVVVTHDWQEADKYGITRSGKVIGFEATPYEE